MVDLRDGTRREWEHDQLGPGYGLEDSGNEDQEIRRQGPSENVGAGAGSSADVTPT